QRPHDRVGTAFDKPGIEDGSVHQIRRNEAGRLLHVDRWPDRIEARIPEAGFELERDRDLILDDQDSGYAGRRNHGISPGGRAEAGIRSKLSDKCNSRLPKVSVYRI